MARSQLVAMSSSEDEGSLRFIYELLGWVEETQVGLSQTFRETSQCSLYLQKAHFAALNNQRLYQRCDVTLIERTARAEPANSFVSSKIADCPFKLCVH